MRLAADVSNVRRLLAGTSEAGPLLDAEFNHIMTAVGPFETAPTLAVAVSGGPDSLALTLLASRWAISRGGRTIGLIVDHGLRATSAEEAHRTGQWLSRYGIEHHILRWMGPKPTTGLQQQARHARYELLFAWCRDAGVLHLLTGHHRQDQAETVALRKARQSGPRGLSGMAAIREVEGLRLLRPLLGIDKARLAATLDDLGQRWIDDPSNRSLRFTRNRLRHDGIDLLGLTGQATRSGQERRNSDKNLHAALAGCVWVNPAGFARADGGQIDALPQDIAENLVANVLTTIGGGSYPPRRRSLSRLVNTMRSHRPFPGETLGHCRISKQDQKWLICRESTNASLLTLEPEQLCRWDNRFMVRSRHRDHRVLIRQLGEHGWSRRHDLAERCKACEIPPAARASLPSIWQGEALLAIPHAGLFDKAFNPLEIDLRFRPSTPLGNAPFAAHMCACDFEKTVAMGQC